MAIATGIKKDEKLAVHLQGRMEGMFAEFPWPIRIQDWNGRVYDVGGDATHWSGRGPLFVRLNPEGARDVLGLNLMKFLDRFVTGEVDLEGNLYLLSEVRNYIKLEMRPMDTGEFTFTIDEYVSSGHYVTKKAEQDGYYMSQLVSSFAPKQSRAIMEHFEGNVLNKAEAILGATANGQYQINNAYHRYAGGNSGVIELADFAYAWYALDKANVPAEGRVAIVDPSTAFRINTLSNLVDVSNNKAFEGIVADGISTGMRFVKNVYGFDVYMSNYLPTVTDSALPERDGSTTFDASAVTAKSNLFFSAAPDVLPFVGAWRQAPVVESEWVGKKQRTEFYTTARYGVKLYRPENMVSVVSNIAVS